MQNFKFYQKWVMSLLSFSAFFPMVFAGQQCPPFLGDSKNVLKQVSLFNRDANQIYELAPGSERQVGRLAILRWDGLSHSDLPVEFKCVYLNASKQIQGRLPSKMTYCIHSFPYQKGVVLHEGKRYFKCYP